MRVLIHDLAGHPFQAQLSRRLVSRGHSVTHVYAAGLPGPKGRLCASPSDSPRLTIRGIPLSSHFKKYSAHRRLLTHRAYARDLKRLIQSSGPDVVMSGNTPIDIQAELLWHCRKNRIPFVHWVQDIYSHALRFFLQRRLAVLSGVLTPAFELLERLVATRSDHVVAIAPDFRQVFSRWKVRDSAFTVIENWAPLEEMPQFPRDNSWSRQQNLGARPVLLYSGTLGLKHRPDLLYLLAEQLKETCTVVVITDGIGKAYLEGMPPLENLRLLPFQPYEKLPEVLASADVLLATLDSDAGKFAVPSKILAYMCVGRPILFAGPRENLAASILERSGGGVVVDANVPDGWTRAAERLVSDANLRARLGSQARSYAERVFDIEKVADSFESVLLTASNRCAEQTSVSESIA